MSLKSLPYSDQQSLQLINSEQVYEAWREIVAHKRDYAGSLVWKKSNGREYLFRLADRRGNGRSLGVRTPETEAVYTAFHEGKARNQAAYKEVSGVLAQQQRLNTATRINRVPRISAEILRRLDTQGLAKKFIVVGTNAMYAYEASAGVFFPGAILATGDIDLLFDRRRRLSIASSQIDPQGLLGLLKSVDASFTINENKRYTAMNASGFMVDLITTTQDMRENQVITFADDDMVASEIQGLQWLVNSPTLGSVVIDEKGLPAYLNAPDPRAFALHKAWLSTRPTRRSIKASRDIAQARAVTEVIIERMPHLSFNDKLLWIHEDVRDLKDMLGIDTHRDNINPSDEVAQFLTRRKRDQP